MAMYASRLAVLLCENQPEIKRSEENGPCILHRTLATGQQQISNRKSE